MNFEFIPDEVLDQIEKIPKRITECTERELEATKKFSHSVRCLRMAFWKEYELAASRMRKMTLSHIALAMGINSNQVEILIRNPIDLAFILCPPASYDNFLDEGLDYGLRRVRDDILTLPVNYIDKDGNERFNVKAAELLLKTVTFLDVRKHGMPKQRIESTNVTGKPQDFINSNTKSLKTLEEVEKRIAELNAAGINLDVAKRILEHGVQMPEQTKIETPTTQTLEEDFDKAKLAKEIYNQDDLKTGRYLSIVKKVTDLDLKDV